MNNEQFFLFCIKNEINIRKTREKCLSKLNPSQKLLYKLDRYETNYERKHQTEIIDINSFKIIPFKDLT